MLKIEAKEDSPAARPFLKWAGGKGQLLPLIARALPHLTRETKFTYIEPFVGSGAVLFWMLAHCPTLEKAIINDVNEDLIGCYRTIAKAPHDLIAILEQWQGEFHLIEADSVQKKHYYTTKRELYNMKCESTLIQSALFIFFNRTCFNGLYRVNAKGSFNVPMGDYKRPRICDSDNILAVSRALQKVEIFCGDFAQTLGFSTPHSFFYIDPPYKPLSQTANFTSYSRLNFDDGKQIRLYDFCQELSKRGSKFLLSNSDVPAFEGETCFFDVLYADFTIERVRANRRISAKASTRGPLNELLIRNY